MANVLNKTLIGGAAALTLAAGLATVPSAANARVFGPGYYGGRFVGAGYGVRGGFYGPRFGYGRGFYGRGFYGPRVAVRVGPGFYGPRFGYGYGYRGPYSYRAIF